MGSHHNIGMVHTIKGEVYMYLGRVRENDRKIKQR